MNTFEWLNKKFSYTFALCFLTIFGGWMSAVFGYYLGTSFILSEYQEMHHLAVKWLPLSVLIPTLLHYITFGFLTPIGIPALLKPLRDINNAFKGGVLNTSYTNDDLQVLYIQLSHLPMYNMIAASLFGMLCGFVLMVFGYYDMRIVGTLTILKMKIGIKIVTIGVLVVVVLYGMSTYLLTEIVTNPHRALVYQELRLRNINMYPRGLIGLRIKFSFFIILMIIILFTFAAMMEQHRLYEETRYINILTYFFVSIVAGVFLMYINSDSVMRILNEMGIVTKSISTGQDAWFRVMSYEKEFAEIEFSILEMAKEIEEHRKNLELKVEQRTEELREALASLKEKDDLIQKQLEIASNIQRSILPGRIDDWNELKFSVRYIAMEKIGGDFYDVYQMKGDRLGILVADVSGHGIPAALITSMAKISFSSATQQYDSPKRVFQEVNQNILEHIKTQDYMTAFFVVIDDDYNVTYANASHQKSILIRSDEGRTELLDTNGLFIGAIEEARETYEEKETKLKYGDRLILYTDGIPESANMEREEYSVERLMEISLKNRHLPLEEFTSYIIEDVQRFKGKAPVEDDITLLVIELARDEAVDIIKQAKKLIEEHKYYEAIDYLERSLALYPNNRKLIYNLAKNYFRVNNFGKASELIEQYLAMDKRNKYAYYVGGAAYYQMMNYEKAIQLLEKAQSLDPNFTNALFALGMAYKKIGMHQDALQIFERVANIDPDNKMALFEINEIRKGLS
ncbi:MAG: SpoIIE family protein phosphatase [Spirochaetota bacterium]